MKKVLRYLLIIIVCYALYIALGAFLINRKVVKEWGVFYNTAMMSESSNQDGSTVGTDGPHVFYSGDTIVVKALVGKDSNVLLHSDTFFVNQRDSIKLSCTFGDHPEWNFETKLKPVLINEPVVYPAPGQLIAISDIEGNFGAFKKMLIANKVMNDDYQWTFGNGHLVLVGDFFDRGLNVTECLWLIYNLEQQAEVAGGKVHFILGNHEIMNMGGDIRYVRNKYIENTYLYKANYKTWFTAHTELGRWLQTKNVVEKVGDMLFVHGGFSEEVNDLNMSLEEINTLCRQHYFTKDSLRRHALEGKEEVLYNGKTSPFWFRKYADEDADEEILDKTLKMYSAATIVIGHTVVPYATKFYKGKVIDIDTKHADGKSEGILYKSGKFYRIDTTGNIDLL
jgi:hypothetical protein